MSNSSGSSAAFAVMSSLPRSERRDLVRVSGDREGGDGEFHPGFGRRGRKLVGRRSLES